MSFKPPTYCPDSRHRSSFDGIQSADDGQHFHSLRRMTDSLTKGCDFPIKQPVNTLWDNRWLQQTELSGFSFLQSEGQYTCMHIYIVLHRLDSLVSSMGSHEGWRERGLFDASRTRVLAYAGRCCRTVSEPSMSLYPRGRVYVCTDLRRWRWMLA